MEINLFKLGQLDLAEKTETDYFSGTVTDMDLKPIPYHIHLINLANNDVIAKDKYLPGQGWDITVDMIPLNQLALKFTSFGFAPLLLNAEALQLNGAVRLQKDPLIRIALEMGLLVALLQLARQKGKKVGALTTGEVLPIVMIFAALLGFSIVKKILEWLGIFKGKDTKDLDHASTDPTSFWNPNFWQTKPANVSYTYAITEETALSWCAEIVDAFGAFNDCEECAIGVFKRCHTQANASFVCWVYLKHYGEDLLTYLRGGWWPQDRLSDADVNVINQYISNLPKW